MPKPSLFILGGSTYYTLLLFEAMYAIGMHHHLSRITLFARNEERLRTISCAGSALFAGAITVDYTLRAEALQQDEYSVLFNQIRFGGLASRSQDEQTALEIGLFADETLGIVGTSNAVRAITGIKPYLTLMQQKTAPYYLVNFTNPCSIITEYIARDFGIPVVGVCDYPQMMRHAIAAHYNVAPSDIDVGYFGINHFGYIHRVRVRGEDKLSELHRANLPFKPDVNRYFHTLLNLSWHYLFEQDQVVREQRQKKNRAAQLLDIEAALDAYVKKEGLRIEGLLAILSQRQCNWFSMVVAPLLRAVVTGTTYQEYLNFSCCNPLLPHEASVIETNAQLIDGRIQSGECLDVLAQGPEFRLVQQMKHAEIQLLNSIVARDLNGVVQACLMNPLIADKSKIEHYFSKICRADAAFSSIFR